jgi:hypothetical protein
MLLSKFPFLAYSKQLKDRGFKRIVPPQFLDLALHFLVPFVPACAERRVRRIFRSNAEKFAQCLVWFSYYASDGASSPLECLVPVL